MTLSLQRLEILANAAQTGDIWELTYNGGPIWVRAGNVDLGDENDRGNQALYVDELRTIVTELLAERRGKAYYRLTGRGFAAAKEALEALQEIPTLELVRITTERAERYQKPRGAIWNELMKRLCWPGCPAEDLALIGNLDSLLRPLNNGCTMLPPKIRHDPNAGIPTPPLYYRKKISLSQVINKPTPKSVVTPFPRLSETTTVAELTKNTNRSPWPSGLFYLFVFVVAFICLTGMTLMLEIHSMWIWPPIIVGSILVTTLIGALQLRHDGKIEERNFLILMKTVFKKMTFLEKIDR